MSRQPIALSPDLLRLQNEGYEIEIRGGYILVKNIPYVNSTANVLRGTLVCNFEATNNVANKPSTHTAYWIGEHPCYSNGAKLTPFEHSSPPQNLGDGIHVDYMFSAKADYRDYHHKVTTYVGRIHGEAQLLQECTPCTFPLIVPDENEKSVFCYADTASSRSGIGSLNDKVAGQRIAIVGLGGTGAYVLDLVAKTPVKEIHLIDGDVFSQHNAFRSPGAASGSQLEEKFSKVEYFHQKYNRLRHGLVPYAAYLTEENLNLLEGMDFVFVCMDSNPTKKVIFDWLYKNSIPFVDVGLGVVMQDEMLTGIVRMSPVTSDNFNQAVKNISFSDTSADGNEYATNIQIAELNSLNAAMAVIRWKKTFGFYRDASCEYYQGFSIATGEMIIERPECSN